MTNGRLGGKRLLGGWRSVGVSKGADGPCRAKVFGTKASSTMAAVAISAMPAPRADDSCPSESHNAQGSSATEIIVTPARIVHPRASLAVAKFEAGASVSPGMIEAIRAPHRGMVAVHFPRTGLAARRAPLANRRR